MGSILSVSEREDRKVTTQEERDAENHAAWPTPGLSLGTLNGRGCLEGQGERVGDGAELLVRAHAGDLLSHHLAEHGDHREASVLQLLELLLPEHLGVVR